MIERRENFRLALEPREAFGVGSHRRREHLEGDRPFQVRVGRFVALAHATGANLTDDFVDAVARAWSEGHLAGDYRLTRMRAPYAEAINPFHRVLSRGVNRR